MNYNYYEKDAKRSRKSALPGDIESGRCLSSSDVSNRFNNSIVLYKGEPVYTANSGITSGLVSVYTLANGKTYMFDVEANDPDLSPKIGRDIGYVNTPKDCYYCTRMPYKKTQFGPNADSISVIENGKELEGQNGVQSVVFSEGTVNALKNVYPTLSECLDLLSKGDMKAIAFDHSFCVSRSLYVYFQGTAIGKYKDDTVYLNENYKDSALLMRLRNLGVATEYVDV